MSKPESKENKMEKKMTQIPQFFKTAPCVM